MKKGYAYLDKDAKVLHIVDTEASAREAAGTGKVQEVFLKYDKGYPIVTGHQYVIGSDGKEQQGRVVPEILQQLVDHLK